MSKNQPSLFQRIKVKYQSLVRRRHKKQNVLNHWNKALADLEQSSTKPDFSGIRSYVSFIGYPRSGHSILGAMLDAHPNCVIADELNDVKLFKLLGDAFSKPTLFQAILNNTRRKMDRGRDKGGLDNGRYSYLIPGGHQGKFDRWLVAGSKYGDQVSHFWRHEPEMVKNFYRNLGMPVVMVHVTRNPFDNIATLGIRRQKQSDFSQQFKFLSHLVSAVADFRNWLQKNPAEPITLIEFSHEDFIADPKKYLIEISDALQLPRDENWLEASSAIVRNSPHHTRDRVKWTRKDIDAVNGLIEKYPFLHQYRGTISTPTA